MSPCSASAVPGIPQSPGPGVAPTLWVHCPESQHTLWDTEEEFPGTVHELLGGFSREKKDSKWIGLHDPSSMVKLRDKGIKVSHVNKFLVTEFVWMSLVVLLSY